MNNISSPRIDDAGLEARLTQQSTAPRVTSRDLDDQIHEVHYFTAADAVRMGQAPRGPLDLLTFCVIVLKNGFTVTGESACASPENFDPLIGKQLAYEAARNKLWPLLGYQLKDGMYRASLMQKAMDRIADEGHQE